MYTFNIRICLVLSKNCSALNKNYSALNKKYLGHILNYVPNIFYRLGIILFVNKCSNSKDYNCFDFSTTKIHHSTQNYCNSI